jgi:hypothetical protein
MRMWCSRADHSGECKTLFHYEKSYAVSISKALKLIEDSCNYISERKKTIMRRLDDRQEEYMLESELKLLYRQYTRTSLRRKRRG